MSTIDIVDKINNESLARIWCYFGYNDFGNSIKTKPERKKYQLVL